MKTLNLKSIALIFLAMLSVASIRSQSPDTFKSSNQYMDSVAAMEMFRNQLSNMGEWINIDSSQVDAEAVMATPSDPDLVNEGFDDHLNKNIIWRPTGIDDPNWNPYSYGFWQYTSSGWMWISYYRWGWWTCHYGRWWYSEEYGWVWSPGYEWGPSWVDWCYNEDYDVWGWYPVSPREHCGGDQEHHHGHHHVRHNNPRWVFVHTKDFEKTVNHNTIVDGTKTPNLVIEKKVVNTIKKTDGNKVINEGPDKTLIETSTGKKIEPINVDALTFGNGTVLQNGNNTGKVIEGTKQNEGKGVVGEKKEPVKIDEGKKSDEGVKKNNDQEKTVWQKEKENQQWNTDNEKKSGNTDYNVKKEERKTDYNNTNNNNTNNNNNTQQKTIEKKQDPPPVKNDDPPKRDIPKDTPKNDTKKGDN